LAHDSPLDGCPCLIATVAEERRRNEERREQSKLRDVEAIARDFILARPRPDIETDRWQHDQFVLHHDSSVRDRLSAFDAMFRGGAADLEESNRNRADGSHESDSDSSSSSSSSTSSSEHDRARKKKKRKDRKREKKKDKKARKMERRLRRAADRP
jgi:hypothetical protein